MPNPLITSVISAHTYPEETLQWVVDVFAKKSSKEDIENRAKLILNQLESQDSRTDKKRFQFKPLTCRERLLKLIFNLSFSNQPDAITAAAETLDPKQAPFYAQWKKVCWIHIPTLAASALDNSFVKVVLSVIVLFLSKIGCRAAYNAILPWIQRKTPFVIKTTPLIFIRATNATLDLKKWANQNRLKIAILMSSSQLIITFLPAIPYVKLLINPLLSVSKILLESPQTIVSFVWSTAFQAAIFTWINCSALSSSIKGRANRASNEKLAICKEKALNVWQRIMLDQDQG